MGKWLTLGGVVVLVLLVLLWREMRPTEANAVAVRPPPPPPRLTLPEGPSVGGPIKPVTEAAAAAPAAPVAIVEAQPGKLDPRSEAFFYKFDEAVPKVLNRNAAKCYEGHQGSMNRNQKLSLTYKVKVVSGEIRVEDVKIKESTLNDAALETCFIQAVQRSTWKDDELPDVAIEDGLVLRPERGMKKYMQDNMNYVGEAAPPL